MTASPNHDRRTFLAALGAATIAACGPTACGASGRRLERIGLQLYTVRELLAQDFDSTLAQVAEIGYDDVEFAGYFGRSPAGIAAALARHGLRAPSSHVAYAPRTWPDTVGAARDAGHTYVTVAWVPEEARRTLDDWRRIADSFNSAGEAARSAGLRFAYHNHAFEFAPIAEDVPYDVLLAGTDPALVGFELDVYWITKAGLDPVHYLERHPERFVMTHLKDSAGPPSHAMRDVGGGTIDFRRILAAAERAAVEHRFVEHDAPADALASIRASHAGLAQLEY